MDRIELFKKWLENLTPEKIELLIKLEKSCRLLTHVYELSTTHDEKILATIRQTSHALRRDYQRVPETVVEAVLVEADKAV